MTQHSASNAWISAGRKTGSNLQDMFPLGDVWTILRIGDTVIQYVAVLTISEIYTVEYIYIWDIYICVFSTMQFGGMQFSGKPTWCSVGWSRVCPILGCSSCVIILGWVKTVDQSLFVLFCPISFGVDHFVCCLSTQNVCWLNQH